MKNPRNRKRNARKDYFMLHPELQLNLKLNHMMIKIYIITSNFKFSFTKNRIKSNFEYLAKNFRLENRDI